MKCLIDGTLSPKLAGLSNDAGHGADRGGSGPRVSVYTVV